MAKSGTAAPLRRREGTGDTRPLPTGHLFISLANFTTIQQLHGGIKIAFRHEIILQPSSGEKESFVRGAVAF